jgi:hypothetical protein
MPTVVISWANLSNQGANTGLISTGQGMMYKALVKFDKTLIPAGTITGFSLRRYYNGYGTFGDVAYRITAANDWIEGSGTGWATNALAGEPCWTWRKYNTQAWAGSAGCNTSGVDFIADANPPRFVATIAGWYVMELPVVWATDWRDNVVVNNGIIIQGDGITASGPNYRSSEAGATGSYFSVTYLAPEVGLNRVAVGANSSGAEQTNGVISNIKIYQRPTKK